MPLIKRWRDPAQRRAPLAALPVIIVARDDAMPLIKRGWGAAQRMAPLAAFPVVIVARDKTKPVALIKCWWDAARLRCAARLGSRLGFVLCDAKSAIFAECLDFRAHTRRDGGGALRDTRGIPHSASPSFRCSARGNARSDFTLGNFGRHLSRAALSDLTWSLSRSKNRGLPRSLPWSQDWSLLGCQYGSLRRT